MNNFASTASRNNSNYALPIPTDRPTDRPTTCRQCGGSNHEHNFTDIVKVVRKEEIAGPGIAKSIPLGHCT